MSHTVSLLVINHDSLFFYFTTQPFADLVRIEYVDCASVVTGLIVERFVETVSFDTNVQIAVAVATKFHAASKYDGGFHVGIPLEILLQFLY